MLLFFIYGVLNTEKNLTPDGQNFPIKKKFRKSKWVFDKYERKVK